MKLFLTVSALSLFPSYGIHRDRIRVERNDNDGATPVRVVSSQHHVGLSRPPSNLSSTTQREHQISPCNPQSGPGPSPGPSPGPTPGPSPGPRPPSTIPPRHRRRLSSSGSSSSLPTSVPESQEVHHDAYHYGEEPSHHESDGPDRNDRVAPSLKPAPSPKPAPLPRPRSLVKLGRSSTDPASTTISSGLRPPRHCPHRRQASQGSASGGGEGNRRRAGLSGSQSFTSLITSAGEDGAEVDGDVQEDALEHLLEVLVAKSRTLGWCHREVGFLHNRVGNCLLRRGELHAAEERYCEALGIFRSLIDEGTRDNNGDDANDHPSAKARAGAWASLGNLGAVLWRTGRARESVPILEEALRLQEEDVSPRHARGSSDGGCRHTDKALILYSLGAALCQCGRGDPSRFDVALDALGRCHRIHLAYPGPGTLGAARTLHALGTAHLLRCSSLAAEKDDASTALACHRDSLVIRRSYLGSSHPSSVLSLLGVAGAYRAMGEALESCRSYRKAIHAQREALRKALVAEDVAIVDTEQEEGEGGRSRGALVMASAARRQAAVDLASALRLLGGAWQDLGDSEAAAKSLMEGISVLKEEAELKEAHPFVETLRVDLEALTPAMEIAAYQGLERY